MTDRQIEIGKKIIELFVENNGQLYDSELHKALDTEYSNKEVRSVLIILIEDYKLIRRNISSTNLKHLTDKGYRASRKGILSIIRNRKQIDFINGFYFKLIIFLIPTIIAIGSIWLNNRHIKKNSQSIDNYYTKEQIDSLINLINKEYREIDSSKN